MIGISALSFGHAFCRLARVSGACDQRTVSFGLIRDTDRELSGHTITHGLPVSCSVYSDNDMQLARGNSITITINIDISSCRK